MHVRQSVRIVLHVRNFSALRVLSFVKPCKFVRIRRSTLQCLHHHYVCIGSGNEDGFRTQTRRVGGVLLCPLHDRDSDVISPISESGGICRLHRVAGK